MPQTNLFEHLKLSEEQHQAMMDSLDQEAGVNNDMKRAFLKYNDNNPQVFDKFCELTMETIKKGFQHYGSQGILELLRWKTGLSPSDPDGFKINNNFAAFYARMFESIYSEYKGFFRKRRSAAD